MCDKKGKKTNSLIRVSMDRIYREKSQHVTILYFSVFTVIMVIV